MSLDRVWITAEGHAKILDFQAPGTAGREVPAAVATAEFSGLRAFLKQAAALALEGRVADEKTAVSMPLPLHAREFLRNLSAFESSTAVIGAIRPLLHKPAEITPRTRLSLTLICYIPPLILALISLAAVLLFQQFYDGDVYSLKQHLMRLAEIRKNPEATESDARRAEAYEILVAGRYRQTISDPALWNSDLARTALSAEERQMAEHIVAVREKPSDEEVKRVSKFLKIKFDKKKAESIDNWDEAAQLSAALYAGMFFFFVVLPSFGSALVFGHGPLLYLLGLAIVTRGGAPAGRARLLWRLALTWTIPFALLIAVLFQADSGKPLWHLAIATAVSTAGFVALALLLRITAERGINDKLAGTWMVTK